MLPAMDSHASKPTPQPRLDNAANRRTAQASTGQNQHPHSPLEPHDMGPIHRTLLHHRIHLPMQHPKRSLDPLQLHLVLPIHAQSTANATNPTPPASLAPTYPKSRPNSNAARFNSTSLRLRSPTSNTQPYRHNCGTPPGAMIFRWPNVASANPSTRFDDPRAGLTKANLSTRQQPRCSDTDIPHVVLADQLVPEALNPVSWIERRGEQAASDGRPVKRPPNVADSASPNQPPYEARHRNDEEKNRSSSWLDGSHRRKRLAVTSGHPRPDTGHAACF